MSVGTVPGEHDTFKGMLIVVDKKDEVHYHSYLEHIISPILNKIRWGKYFSHVTI